MDVRTSAILTPDRTDRTWTWDLTTDDSPAELTELVRGLRGAPWQGGEVHHCP